LNFNNGIIGVIKIKLALFLLVFLLLNIMEQVSRQKKI